MKLAKREKLFVSSAGIVIGVFLILQLLVIPFFDKKNKLTKETATLENLIKEMNSLGISGQDMSKISGGLDRVLSARRDTLSNLIYSDAEAAGIKQQNIAGMVPRDGESVDGYLEDIVEVRLNAITLHQLTEFLYRIENPDKFIYIKMFSVKDNKREEGYLDATIRVMSYKKENPEQ